MRIVTQRVSKASIKVSDNIVGTIKKGLLIYIGVEERDSKEDVDWLVNKIIHLRIFNDSHNVMNLSVKDINGEILVVSQFTLLAKTKKGSRPSYIRAAEPTKAKALIEYFDKELEHALNKKISTGEFGASMKVEAVNDGPVTIWIDTKNKE